MDAGFADEDLSGDNMLVGAGFGLVTCVQLARETFTALRIGVPCPVVRPEPLNQSGPVFLFRLGRPL